MSLGAPKGTEMQKIAAWETIAASILLFFMTSYKFLQIYHDSQPMIGVLPASFNRVIVNVMGEHKIAHAMLYLVIFVLVFSSAIMGYFYDDSK